MKNDSASTRQASSRFFFDGTSHLHCSFVITSASYLPLPALALQFRDCFGHDAVKASVPKLFGCPGAASSTPASRGSRWRVARWRLRKPTTPSALAFFCCRGAKNNQARRLDDSTALWLGSFGSSPCGDLLTIHHQGCSSVPDADLWVVALRSTGSQTCAVDNHTSPLPAFPDHQLQWP